MRVVNKYLLQVKRRLKYPMKLKRKILESLQYDLEDWVKENKSNPSLHEIYEYFGTPEEMAQSSMNFLTPEDKKAYKKETVRKYITISISTVLIGITSFFAVIFLFALLPDNGVVVVLPEEVVSRADNWPEEVERSEDVLQ